MLLFPLGCGGGGGGGSDRSSSQSLTPSAEDRDSGSSTDSSPAMDDSGVHYFGADDGNLDVVLGKSAMAASDWPMFKKDLDHPFS